ncbi:tereporin-Ca1-like isoform X2 [Argopecten irradians]|uniref:tereporin-Ca1-like isoform X2 n=1 Tax=Argopecten irradians TaxID=31199 RepID=UPI0037147376
MLAAANLTAAAVSAGSSLAGTTISALTANVDVNVACGFEISNWTKYVMEKPMAYPKGGRIKIPPVEIFPGVKEAMVTHKTPLSVMGSYGTASWLIQDRRVVVMWDAPFNFDFNSNWLGVGITKKGKTSHIGDFYDIMYTGKQINYMHPNADFRFNRKIFRDDVNSVSLEDDDALDVEHV